ncbi:hypothetical protein IJJ49_02350 [Candidatus Saccharibacteria bacterium]|nr:hypothetical protein [Candidatus Saccharibacteria bacterium]
MENKAYLEQISAATRPVKKKNEGFLSSIYFKVIVGGILGIVAIMILGSILSAGRGSEKTRTISLEVRISNTVEVVKKYQTEVKSSDLRSNGASFLTVLSNTAKELSEFLAEKYEFKEKNVDKEISAKEEPAKNELETDLFSAKINGILDRIFAHKMAYEISVITTREEEIIKSTRNAELKEILTTSYNSLENLYGNFNDFSEAN